MKKLLCYSFLFIALLNCIGCDDATDCATAVCTLNLVTITVTVKNASDTAVALDRFEVLDKESSENITIALNDNEMQMALQSGQYPLYDDSFVSGNRNSKRFIIFRGYIDNNKVVDAEYEVETDCCHVNLVSGDTNIVVN